MNKIFILLIVLFCSVLNVFSSDYPATEVRAVWFTTNYGLDWPHNRTSVEEQKKELIEILDMLKEHNFNTVMFQARSRGEVLYISDIEPMSTVIAASKNRSEQFDPLAFAVEECHKRGLEIHAWVVTYPLGGERHVRDLGSKSVTKKIPSITKKFQREWFLDPGNPRTDDYLISIVDEIVEGYDVDGVHFDYIRYPDNRGRFPDDGLYRQYGKGKSRDDWRRDNITRFVNRVYDTVKARKPWVQVSSSPLGRYRTLNERGQGWTALETVYQDAGKWMQTGKHDALYPMMYYKDELFYPYLDDWKLQCNDRFLVPGIGLFQMLELRWPEQDIIDQVNYTRKVNVQGQAYFRTEDLYINRKGILDELDKFYKYPAKIPAMTWLSETIPGTPQDLRAEKLPDGMFELKWEKIDFADEVDNPGRVTYNVYRSEDEDFSKEDPEKILALGLNEPHFYYPAKDDDIAYYYYITVSDSFNNESEVSTPAFFYHSETIK